MDTEGGIEFFRACFIHNFAIVPVAPLDYSVCMVLKALGAKQIEIEVGNPHFEEGIQRRRMLEHIIQTIEIPIIAGGIFQESDKDALWEMGAHAILNYERFA